MASQGPNSPGTCADDATVGTVAWSNPDNAKVSDNVYAIENTAGTTHYLKATNFGFTIPVGATINGIFVEIERYELYTGEGNVKDSVVKIVKSDGTIGTTNKADTVNNWPTSDTYKSYGASDDLWDETWAYSDINDTDFGVVLSALVGHTVGANVDHIRITVYYTETSGRNLASSRSNSSSRNLSSGRNLASNRNFV
jgi:hypothetical protein